MVIIALPDKRGRVGVGVTTGMGGGAFSPVVDPKYCW
jgi:hypothetical protein